MGANDQFKTSFLEDTGIFPYKQLCTLLCDTGNARDALYVEELGRARGLSKICPKRPKDLPLANNFRSLGILPTKDCEDRSLNMVKLQPLCPA